MNNSVDGIEDTDKNFAAIPINKQLVYMFFFKEVRVHPSEVVLEVMYDVMNHYAIQGTFNFVNSNGHKTGIIEQACEDNHISTADFYKNVTGEALYPEDREKTVNETIKMSELENKIAAYVNASLN